VNPIRRTIRLLRFAGYFGVLLVRSNWQLAKEVLRPTPTRRCRFLRYDVRGLSEAEIATLASAITLTPGTMTVDADRESLLIHAMFADDRDAIIAETNQLRDALLRGVFR
jgi:multisubunit Na+/H+ antiporter MnhE subunit